MANTLYIPVVGGSTTIARDPKKGIGITNGLVADVNLLQCNHYHTWGSGDFGDPRFRPLTYFGNVTVPRDWKSFVIFLNEPGNKGQSNIDADIAAELYRNFVDAVPDAKMIVGNDGIYGKEWTLNFKSAIDALGLMYHPYGWGVHGYVEPNVSVQRVIDYWNWFASMIVDADQELQITEFGDVWGRVPETEKLIEWASLYSNAYYIFTNDIPVNVKPTWYPSTWPWPPLMSLFDQSGNLTTLGRVYRER